MCPLNFSRLQKKTSLSANPVQQHSINGRRDAPIRCFQKNLLRRLFRSQRFDRERMYGTSKLFAQRIVNQSLACNAVQPLKCRRNNKQPEMGLAAFPGAGMTGVKMRLVRHFKTFGRQRPGQFFGNGIRNPHVPVHLSNSHKRQDCVKRQAIPYCAPWQRKITNPGLVSTSA